MDERGPTRALILASEVDSSFCSGADLKERAGFSQDEYVALQWCTMGVLYLRRIEG